MLIPQAWALKKCANEGAEGVCPRKSFQQASRMKEGTGEGAVHAGARSLRHCAGEGAERMRQRER